MSAFPPFKPSPLRRGVTPDVKTAADTTRLFRVHSATISRLVCRAAELPNSAEESVPFISEDHI